MRIGAGEVEGGERLGVGVVELADVGVEEESADLKGEMGKRGNTSSKSWDWSSAEEEEESAIEERRFSMNCLSWSCKWEA